MARLLPPESARLEEVAREVGIGEQTLERWRSDALGKPARDRVWTAAARLDAVLTTAAMHRHQRAPPRGLTTRTRTSHCRKAAFTPVPHDRRFDV
ncbi:MAG: transposition helper protein [Frankiales bacterium]|nr:transposition helper protein [Frankiales bacterium]